jgi:inosine/xanthosine triphosphate pyrophosphatase family protein
MNGDNYVSLKHNDVVYNQSNLTVITKEQTHHYEDKIIGYIDLTRHNNNSFDWDSVFVSINNNLSNYEMQLKDIKMSARNKTLGLL